MREALRSSDLRKGRVSARGTTPFTDFQSSSAVCCAFQLTARQSSITLLAWVLMPDHAHWLLQLHNGGQLSDAVAALKRNGAGAFNRHQNMHRGKRVWQSGFYDRALRHDEDMVATARYVVANPLRAGLVAALGDYPYWDAIWLGRREIAVEPLPQLRLSACP
jgi:putative transposase